MIYNCSNQQLQQHQDEMAKRRQQRDQLATELRLGAEKLQPLGRDGSEGELRKRYVAKMQELEDTSELLQEIHTLETNHTTIQQTINAQLQALNETTSNEG